MLAIHVRRSWAVAMAIALSASTAQGTEPCDDFGECKALIEINATDGDIGFHFLMDGDELVKAQIRDPGNKMIFSEKVSKALKDQTLTEIFAESAEPVCRAELAEEEDETVVTLEQFVARWPDGTYSFRGKGADKSKQEGATELTHDIPAAPADLEFDPDTGEITWSPGDDLGECATHEELDALVADGTLPTHPEDVTVREWEAVFEPDTEDGDPTGNLKFSTRVPAGQTSVTVPAELLDSLPADTPAKVEVGAIGLEDNATFSEEGDFCINEDAGCGDEE